METDSHFIREKIEDEVIRIKHVASRDQVVDIFTKPVSVKLFQNLEVKLDRINIYTNLESECKKTL